MSRLSDFLAYLESHIGDMYVWGAQGQCVSTMADPYSWIERRETSDTNYNRAVKFMEKATKRPLFAFDCSGLIVHFISDQKHWMSGDTNAQGLYVMCGENRGYIGRATMWIGDLLFKYSDSSKKMVHVGVYVGDGYTIEAKGRDDGVCKRKLADGGWTHWGRLALLQQEGEEQEAKVKKTITLTVPMMRGNDIKTLQTALNLLGYDAGDEDGIAGSKTITAIENFAAKHAKRELPDGIQATVTVGTKTYVGTLKK